MEVIEQHFRENRTMLVQRFYKATGCMAAAEDIVQEAYARALKYFESYDSSQPIDNWFSTICRNAFYQFQQEERGHFHEELDEFSIPGWEDPLAIGVLWDQIIEMIQNERHDVKEVLHLHFSKGYSPLEISHVSKLSYGNIRKIISRFRLKVQKELQ